MQLKDKLDEEFEELRYAFESGQTRV